MSTIKTPKTTYIILGIGIAIGAIATASVLGGYSVGKAFAQRPALRTAGNLSAENLALLRNLNASFASLADYIEPAVVNIRVESTGNSDIFGRRVGQVGGEGSGVIIRPDGWILTNDHVVGGMEKVNVTLSDGREFRGTVRRSNYSDLAVVKIEANSLPTVQFSDSNRVKAGQFAIAVGSPFGLENSVTIGHVSALGRMSSIGDARTGFRRDYPDLIQTDAAINQGNSGGPLLDIEGKVIGINTAIYSETGGSVGIGFAIPANQARLTAEALIEKGKIVRGYLGVNPTNIKPYQTAELGVTEGAYVAEFGDSNIPSPARVAGVKEGDVITKIGGLNISNHADLRNSMLRYAPGESVTVEYLRNKVRKTVTIKLIAPPALPAQSRTPQPRSGNNGDGGTPEVPMPFPDMEDMLPKTSPAPNELQEVPPVRNTKARLGIQIEGLSETVRSQFHIPSNVSGVAVTAVEPGSVAQKVGLKIGDVIQRIGNFNITSPEDVTKAMADITWGQRRQVKFSRYGENMSVSNDVSVLFR